jgi:AraC-like DNA-binding protein
VPLLKSGRRSPTRVSLPLPDRRSGRRRARWSNASGWRPVPGTDHRAGLSEAHRLGAVSRCGCSRADACRQRSAVVSPGAARRATISHVTSRPAAAQHLRDLALLRRVRDRIDREYAQPLDVEALASGAHMSPGHFSRQFRLAYGESPYSYLMTRRIERAMALLRRGDLGVTDVCFEVGCSSLGTFSSRFTELVGMPPSTYRRHAARATTGMPPCVAKQVTRPIRNREAPAAEPHLA